MTGLFSLGEGRETNSSRNNHHLLDFQQHNQQNTNFLSLASVAASNEPSAPQHHQKALPFQDLYSSAAGGLAMTPCRNLFNIFEEDPYDASSMMMMRSSAGFTMMNGSCGGFGEAGGGSVSCQDCGNQAKKDCPHKRCRTCCRSRGFDCQTHVKSTWVPAAKRREKMLQLQQHEREQKQQLQQHEREQKQQQQQQYYTEHDPKRHGDRIIPTKGGGRTGLEVLENFPAEVQATAIFRCVRVRSIGDDENVTNGTHDQDQYAYQTAVSIGGHLFKGTVYDQGPAHHHYHHSNDCDHVNGAEKSTGLLNLITAAMTTNNTTATHAAGGGSPAPSFFDPSLNYPAPLNSFMSSDAEFFPHPRS